MNISKMTYFVSSGV